MNLQEFRDILLPFRKKLYMLELIDCVVKTINRIIFLTIIISIALLFVDHSLRFFGNYVSVVFKIAAVAIAVLYGVALVIRKSFRSLSWQFVTVEVDRVSNKHDLVHTAYEFVGSEKDSAFAQLAIIEGRQTLSEVVPGDITGKYNKINSFSVIVALLLLLVCFLSNNLSVADQSFVESKVDQKANVTVVNIPEPVLKNSNRASAIALNAANNSSAKLRKTNLFSSFASNQPGASLNGSSLGSKSGSNLERTRSARDISRNSSQSKSANGINLKGIGNALTSPIEISIKTEYLNIDTGLKEDQLESMAKGDRKSGNMSSSSKRPFLDDKRSAPGRELGRSGKKGKPGDGRGGLGSVKKSRSTASIFPGEKIRVHIKSSPGKGKSKSFQLNSPLQSSKNNYEKTMEIGDTHEGYVDSYIIKKHLKTKTKKYFQELNSHANRMHK